MKQHHTLRSLRKNENNNFTIFTRSVSRQGELVMFYFKKYFCEWWWYKKVIANKFWWKYLILTISGTNFVCSFSFLTLIRLGFLRVFFSGAKWWVNLGSTLFIEVHFSKTTGHRGTQFDPHPTPRQIRVKKLKCTILS